MKFIFVFLFLQDSLICFSQKDKSDTSGQILNAFWGYKKDGVRLNQRELRNELYKVPETIPYYQKAQKNKILFFSMGIPAAALTIISTNNRNSNLITSKKPGLQIAGITLLTGSWICFFSHLSNMKKAVRAYNKTVITY